MKVRNFMPIAVCALALAGSKNSATAENTESASVDYTVDRFADIEVLRYTVPGFEDLSLNQKKLI